MSPLPPAGNRTAVERAVSDLIEALGLDPGAEPELAHTPARVADLYGEIFAGLDPSREPELPVFEHPGSNEDVVVLRDVAFHSLCVHHFVPFFGRAHIAYVPDRGILGISGPARLLEFYARRPQLQERLTAQLADHLARAAKPRGVAVRIVARHLCMEMRGIRRFARVETWAIRGDRGHAARDALVQGASRAPES